VERGIDEVVGAFDIRPEWREEWTWVFGRQAGSSDFRESPCKFFFGSTRYVR
jgi:hypothetical protein